MDIRCPICNKKLTKDQTVCPICGYDFEYVPQKSMASKMMENNISIKKYNVFSNNIICPIINIGGGNGEFDISKVKLAICTTLVIIILIIVINMLLKVS